jgi:hypothetical protein
VVKVIADVKLLGNALYKTWGNPILSVALHAGMIGTAVGQFQLRKDESDSIEFAATVTARSAGIVVAVAMSQLFKPPVDLVLLGAANLAQIVSGTLIFADADAVANRT